MTGAEGRLHTELVSWARESGWDEFTPLQLDAFEAILSGNSDIILAGGTARGKTEAAFLPLLTTAARRKAGVSVLCISPRKALINDQYRRLHILAKRVGVPLYKWHGEASQTGKVELVRNRRGIVLITPESLEGRFLRKPLLLKRLFGQLDAIVIDELHDFLGGVRGHQLTCQLARIDQLSDGRTRRIGLSATLGDLDYARSWLAPFGASGVKVIKEEGVEQPFLFSIRGYEDAPRDDVPVGTSRLRARGGIALGKIADAIFARHRKGTHLVFAGSKRNVESMCDLLHGRARNEGGGDDRFRAHHGNLGKISRERIEEELRSGKSLTVVTTTTLELGIDIGTVDGIDQIGAPRSLTAFRQRVGRSGRRSEPAMVTIHVTEQGSSSSFTLLDRLRLDTVRAVASINLLKRRFIEPPEVDATMLTVVFQQTLSFINERGGATLLELQRLMRSVTPFRRLSESSYKAMLTEWCGLRRHLLYLSSEGRYCLAEQGEKLVESYEFYACFFTGAVWDVWSAKERIGSISLANPVAAGNLLCLAGRSWKILAVDSARERIDVEPSPGGRIPYFEPGGLENIHEVLAKEMRNVLGKDRGSANGCDKEATRFLEEGRAAYSQARLSQNSLIEDGGLCHIFTWKGSKFNELLAVLLRKKGFTCGPNEISVTVPSASSNEIREALAIDMPNLEELAEFVEALNSGKFDKWIPEPILRRDWYERNRDLEETLCGFCLSLAQDIPQESS